MFNLTTAQLFNILSYGLNPYRNGVTGRYCDPTGTYKVSYLSNALHVTLEGTFNHSLFVEGSTPGVGDIAFKGEDGSVNILRENEDILLIQAIPNEPELRYLFLYDKGKGMGLRKGKHVPELMYGKVQNLNDERWALTFE